MNDPMTILKADHREVKRLLTALGDSEEGPEREEMAAQLDAALRLHMHIEEDIIYPSIAEYVGQEDEEEAEVEHRLAREGLTKMLAMVEEPGFGAAAEMLLGGIRHHVEEEETELLPGLKEALPRYEWLALGDAIAQIKQDEGQSVAPTKGRRSQKRKTSKNR